jgi:hypothetical protein
MFVHPEDVEEMSVDVPPLEVELSDNPIVNELLGPDGEVIARFSERPVVAFGFRRA